MEGAALVAGTYYSSRTQFPFVHPLCKCLFSLFLNFLRTALVVNLDSSYLVLLRCLNARLIRCIMLKI